MGIWNFFFGKSEHLLSPSQLRDREREEAASAPESFTITYRYGDPEKTTKGMPISCVQARYNFYRCHLWVKSDDVVKPIHQYVELNIHKGVRSVKVLSTLHDPSVSDSRYQHDKLCMPAMELINHWRVYGRVDSFIPTLSIASKSAYDISLHFSKVDPDSIGKYTDEK